MINTTGILKFYNDKEGFGFAETPHGDVRIGREAVADVNVADLVGGAEVALEVLFAEKGLDAVSVKSVALTYRTGVIRWFNKEKRMGFIAQANDNEKDVLLSFAVAAEAGALPWEGLVVEYVLARGKNGRLEASKVRFPSIMVRVAALEAKFGNEAAAPVVEVAVEESAPAPVEALPSFVIGETVEGVIRGYNAKKGFGFLRVEGRKDDLFVHVSKAKAIADIANGLTAICEVGENKQGFAALNVRLPSTEAPAVAAAPAPAKKQKKVLVRKKRSDGSVTEPEAAPKPAKKPKSQLPMDVVASASPPEGSTVDGPFAALANLNGLDDSAPYVGQPVH